MFSLFQSRRFKFSQVVNLYVDWFGNLKSLPHVKNCFSANSIKSSDHSCTQGPVQGCIFCFQPPLLQVNGLYYCSSTSGKVNCSPSRWKSDPAASPVTENMSSGCFSTHAIVLHLQPQDLLVAPLKQSFGPQKQRSTAINSLCSRWPTQLPHP